MDDQNLLPGLEGFIGASRTQFEAQLTRLVGIPTVSADPLHGADIKKGVAEAVSLLKEVGFKTEILNTPGNPLVTATLQQDPSYPTITIYNHLDVQPADPAEWQTDPFTLSVVGDNYTGRGSTDDKGPALTALMAIRYAHASHIKVNFKVIWELEEELGSPNFASTVASHAQDLSTDCVVVSDTIWISKQKPAIPTGLRGLVTFEVTIRTGEKDVHSGLAGGAARNPLGELSQIITECYDASSGRVRIPGFYDSVKPVSKAEKDGLALSGFTARQFMTDHQLSSLRSTDDVSVMSRVTLEPTFEVHGITGGYTGPGIKTIIPSHATAKLSARLVPDQDPHAVIELISNFIKSRHPDALVKVEATASPYFSDQSGPYARAAARAVEFAFNAKPALVREGGTIGAVISLHKYLKVPVIMLGLSLPEHGYHAAGEHYDWHQASGGIKMFACFFAQIAELAHR
jgi:acetylornithine deacetylase/succinyl-diaminopimelate desuccinylase-like protein